MLLDEIRAGTMIGNTFSSSLIAFQGTLNGRGYSIKNLYARGKHLGLFGYNYGGTIQNVNVHANLYATDGRDNRVGGVVMNNAGTMIAVSSSGTITVPNTNYSATTRLGGLASYNQSDGTIAASYSTMNIEGSGASENIGGLAYSNSGYIASSYSTGTLNGSTGFLGRDNGGGLAYLNTSGVIISSYAAGRMSNFRIQQNVASGGTITESYGYPTGNRGERALSSGTAGGTWKGKCLGFWYQQPVPTLTVGNCI